MLPRTMSSIRSGLLPFNSTFSPKSLPACLSFHTMPRKAFKLGSGVFRVLVYAQHSARCPYELRLPTLHKVSLSRLTSTSCSIAVSHVRLHVVSHCSFILIQFRFRLRSVASPLPTGGGSPPGAGHGCPERCASPPPNVHTPRHPFVIVNQCQTDFFFFFFFHDTLLRWKRRKPSPIGRWPRVKPALLGV